MRLTELRSNFRSKILTIAAECNVSTVKIFGSTARGDAKENSDIDFLISLKKNASLLDVGRFKWKIEELLNKKVDIAFENCVHASIKNQVTKEAQVL